MTAALLMALLALAPADQVEVRILSKLHPHTLQVEGGRRMELLASHDALLVNGAAVQQPLSLPEGAWRLATGRDRRRYEGALRLRAVGEELEVVATFALEEYVAEVVASETNFGTPAAALEAQAIVVRSYATASGSRHEVARLCDLAHCQVLRGAHDERHRKAALVATQRTAGAVLSLEGGSAALPTFHAACGGHTADPREIFGGEDHSGAASVPDEGCAAHEWTATIALSQARSVLAGVLGDFEATELQFGPGRGGFVTQVVNPRSGEKITGERFARTLDAALGYGKVRSPRFTVTCSASAITLKGSGLGHGVGLCQEGAARMALKGASAEAILKHYFPAAVISRP